MRCSATAERSVDGARAHVAAPGRTYSLETHPARRYNPRVGPGSRRRPESRPGWLTGLTTTVHNIVYFDLETQKSAEEVGGWNHIRDMRMSVGVTFSTRRGTYQIYGEPQVNDLIEELRRADLVVGFNILRFDYDVLIGHSPFFDPQQVPTLDLLVALTRNLPHRLSLDSIASATLGVEKTSDGLQAIRWYRAGQLLPIAEYCCFDVKITRLVHEYGRDHHQLFYTNRFGKKQSIQVQWTTPTNSAGTGK